MLTPSHPPPSKYQGPRLIYSFICIIDSEYKGTSNVHAYIQQQKSKEKNYRAMLMAMYSTDNFSSMNNGGDGKENKTAPKKKKLNLLFENDVQ